MPNHLKKRVGKIIPNTDVASHLGGSLVASKKSIALALEQAGLNWETLVAPVCLSDKLRTKIPGVYGTYRKAGPNNNIPLGTVRSRYKPTHNRESFAWLDRVVGGTIKALKSDAFLTAGGMINDGVRVWMAVDLGFFAPVDGDEVRRTMIVLNSNDGSSNWTVHMIPTRILGCVSLNFHDVGGFYKIRHTKGSALRMAEIETIMKIGVQEIERFEKTCKLMAKKKISTEEGDRLIYQSLGVSDAEFAAWYHEKKEMKQPQWVNQYEAIREMMSKGTAQGTVWGLLTAVAGYFDYVRTVRGSETRKDNVYESRMIGYSARQKYQAYQACTRFIS